MFKDLKIMKTNIIANITNMKSYLKYLCAVLLVIGTSAHAWALVVIEQNEIKQSDWTNYADGSGYYKAVKYDVTMKATSIYKNGSSITIPASGSVTIEAPEGGKVTKIHFTPNSTYGGMNYDLGVSSGTYIKANSIWTGDASSVTLTATAGSNIAWNTATVTISYTSDSYVEIDVSPNSKSWTASIDEVTSGQTFTYSGLGDFDYSDVYLCDDPDYSTYSYSDVTIGGHAIFSVDASTSSSVTISATGDAIGTYTAYLAVEGTVGWQGGADYHYVQVFVPLTLTVNAVCTTNPTVSSGSSSDIRSTTATVSCSGISSLGSAGCTISSYGFVVSTTSNPTIGGAGVTKWQVGTSYTTTGTSFSQALSGLTPNTTYYVKPYATNGHGTSYGSQFSFTTLRRYTITYNNNGGEGTIANEYKDYGINATLNAGTNFSRTGYTLDRWDSNSSGTGNHYALSGTYNGNTNLNLFAIWTANPYTITLNNQSATTAGTTSISVTYNANTNLSGTPAITVPTKTGYTFGGYFTSTEGEGTQLIAANGNVNASVDGFTSATKQWIYANGITLYAYWTANTINLTLDKNCASGSNGSASVLYDATALESVTSHATNSDANYHLVGYYAEAGTSTKVLESNGAFAASSVTGYITDGKWSCTTTPTTLHAKWVMTTYTVTFNMHDHGEAIASQEVESGSKVATPAEPNEGDAVDGWRFLGWYTDDGAGSATNTKFDFANTTITANTTIHAKWSEITYSDYKGWCEPDITITGDIHLTSVNGIAVYATSTTNNLLRIQSEDLAGVNKLEIKYLDADDDDAEVAKGSSLFRFCNDGSENYNVADGSQIDVSASNTYDQTFSISYTPTAYNVTNHYKLQITMKHGTNVLKTVTHDLYGRSLPEEFVIATKGNDNIWYALPNTIVDNTHAVAPIRITVNHATTPTAATYAPNTTVFKGDGRYNNAANRYAVRFTDGVLNNEDKLNHLQISSSTDTHYPWLSYSGSSTNQDWWLKSTDCSAYELKVPTSGATSAYKLGIYSGNMGYFPSVTSGSIFLLPITNEVVDNPASVTEWGKKKVILDVDAQGMAGARAHIGDGEPETANLFGETRTSVKSSASKYNYTIGFSSTDFSAHKGELLYVDWLDGEGEVVSTSAVTIPWIIAENTTMSEISTTQAYWKDWEVHVLPGVTFTADGASGFASNTAKIYTLEIYPGATVNVSSGILDVTQNLILHNGWTRAGSKDYDVARLYIPSTSTLKTNHVYADWYIDFDQYYPVAVPWEATIANFSYKNSNTTATIDGTSGTLRLRYYDGASRAENGQVGVGDGVNWKAYGAAGANAVPDKMVPGVGYALTAKRPTGKAFSIIRMPLTIPAATWITDGEQGYVSSTHKDQVTITASGVSDPSKPRYTVGWNFIANPYMSIYQGDITHSVNASYNVEYVNIPDIEFKNYGQYPVGAVGKKLLPASGFFIQAAADGVLTFGTSNRKASAPSFYSDAKELASKQKAYILLNGAKDEDMMGLIVAENYTEEYEINADLEKLLGEGNSLKTYMYYGDMNMAYVAINETLAKEWIPVSVRIPSTGEYTFSMHEASVVGELEGVYLIDYANGDKITNLMEENYVFEAEAGTISGRFAINAKVGGHKVPTDIDVVNAGGDLNSDKPVKFIWHDKVYILHRGVIYDAMGKKVREINR